MPKANTSTNATQSTLDSALAKLPAPFRQRIVEKYLEIRAAYADGNHDTVGLRTGVFCETVYRFLQESLTGSHTPFGTQIRNFPDECRKLEQLQKAAGDESLRVIIPRALSFAYTLRNKRGVGHAAGDVDANGIDAATCMRVADWILCELIRLFKSVSLEEAQQILDAISARQLPEVWSVSGRKRVLHTQFDYKEQVLLLLHGDLEAAVPVEDLFEWVEHPRMNNFKRDVLRPLHRARLIEFDETTDTVTLSPTGAKQVEESLMPRLRA